MKPPCLFPKQPTGPSGFGSGAVRRVQSAGGDYQRTRPDDSTLSIKSGKFSRVVIEDVPEYLTAATEGVMVSRDTKRYQQGYRKSRANIDEFATSMTQGLYAIVRQTIPSRLLVKYIYEVYPGTSAEGSFFHDISDQLISFSGYYLKGVDKARVATFFSRQRVPSGQLGIVKAADRLLFWGKNKEHGRVAVAFGSAYYGRNDSVGRPLHDGFFYRVKQKGASDAFKIDVSTFTRDNAEFCSLTPTIVLKDFTVAALGEFFFRPGPTVPGEDYRPKFWLVVTPNTELFGTSYFCADVTADLFGRGDVPEPSGSPEHYGVSDGQVYSADLSVTMSSMGVNMQAVDDNTFVAAWQQKSPLGWVQCVGRVTVIAGSVVASITYESAPNGNRALVHYWQSVVHVGGGIVVAKVLSGWPGTDHAVTFRKSTDGGASWGADYLPAGLEAPLKNQFFGNLMLHSAKDEKRPGTVLMNGWSEAEGKYFTYASDDYGASWVRAGEIYKPSTFLRVDSMLDGDGGGNFGTLLPGPSLTRLADPSLPNRYKGRP